jgi:hypothetical protein
VAVEDQRPKLDGVVKERRIVRVFPLHYNMGEMWDGYVHPLQMEYGEMILGHPHKQPGVWDNGESARVGVSKWSKQTKI